MDTQLKEKWITALRSGKYLQGHGEMFNAEKGTHCCLGVLCRVTKRSLTTGYEDDRYDFAAGQIGSDDLMTNLWKMNDGADGFEKHDFKQIANFIEVNL
jgi:hypothetical protein